MNIGWLLDLPWVEVIDSAEKLAKIGAIVGAAIWGYYRFLRGRTFRPRLELSLTAAFHTLGQRAYLYANGRLKNVGLSKVKIDSSVSGLRVLSLAHDDIPSSVDVVEWAREVTLPAFRNHLWIEPSELVEDCWLIALPNPDASAFRLELRVAGVRTSWSAESVALPSSPVPSSPSLTSRPHQA